MTSLRLRPLGPADEAQALAAHEELAAEDFSFLLGWHPGGDWASFVAELDDRRHGRGLADWMVPETFLVAEADGVLVGRVSVRHTLNEALARRGGHIGYGVRPAFRRRGHATGILRQSLGVARGLGLERALVTCDDANVASVRTIERCGGVLEDVVTDEGRPATRRYWIDLTG